MDLKEASVSSVISEYHKRITTLQSRFPTLKTQRLTPNLLALHTKVRNSQGSRKDFVYYSQRIIRLLIEEALDLFPYSPVEVITPTNSLFRGCELVHLDICGVSILRAGSAMETVFRSVTRTAPLGQILIQRDEESREKTAKLFYAKLPVDIASRKVLLMDPMLATGGSAAVAVASLVEKGVRPSDIIFVNLVSCPEGIEVLLSKFPQITIFTSMIDDRLNNSKYIVPGLGDFGDLYFGTGDSS